MSHRQDECSMSVVTACMTREGTPAFALTAVVVTHEQVENGIHYYLVEAELLERGYEEPFVHFDENEAPPFLHAAVRQQLGEPLHSSNPAAQIPSEKQACPA